MHLVIGGGTGVVGRALCVALTSAGHSVRVVTRTPRAKSDLSWGTVKHCGLPDDTEGVLNFSGRSIGETNPMFILPRPYKQYMDEVFSSRIETNKILTKACESMPIKIFISASAVGYYPPDLSKKFTESEPFKECNILTRLVKQWEDAAHLCNHPEIRQFQLRLGVVLARDSAFIRSIYPSHRFGFGGPVGNGHQWISWIHLEDVTRIVEYLLKPDCPVPVGPVNATAPNAIRQAAFSKAFTEAIKAPSLPFGPIKTPSVAVKLLLGAERATLVLDGHQVIPKKLLDAGFKFKYPRAEDALQAIFRS
ncbi:unnamed protein product [Calicophoron daubneyi]|uniref:TIGR01777 family protein n=1 Tax=Calicophoron daubneyi TaxID=300641 RepID=A0AAV2TQB9_CALDB